MALNLFRYLMPPETSFTSQFCEQAQCIHEAAQELRGMVDRPDVATDTHIGTIRAIEKQPELAQFKFRARNEWDIGGHNVATVDSFYGTCQEMEHKQPFVMHADEPAVLLGEDNGANPVEFVLAGLSGCMTTTLAYHAAGRGLSLEEVSSEFEGDIDLQGLLDINPTVRSGYREIRVKFRVKGDADEATIQ